VPKLKAEVALARRKEDQRIRDDDADYETVVGVVYDPFFNELWTAARGKPARLNGKIIRPSTRGKLTEAIVSLGFAKSQETLEQMLPAFNELLHRVRKIRIMGAAALAMTYVACGRFDAYVEAGVRLWDVAAGGLILECAGGEFWRRQLRGEHRYAVIANNGLLRRKLQKLGSAEETILKSESKLGRVTAR
jgi:myo-inositol-1(or 4)-monophosphatase